MKQGNLFDSASPARRIGLEAEEACTDKAERVTSFRAEVARQAVLHYLRHHGPARGEVIVNALKELGHKGHDDRCFGSVFSVLARRGLIECIGYTERAKGHGAPGGSIWRLK